MNCFISCNAYLIILFSHYGCHKEIKFITRHYHGVEQKRQRYDGKQVKCFLLVASEGFPWLHCEIILRLFCVTNGCCKLRSNEHIYHKHKLVNPKVQDQVM